MANKQTSAKVRAAQQQKRQRMQWSVGIIVLVAVGIVVLVLAKMSTSDTKATVATGRSVAPASVARDIDKVSVAQIATAHASRLKSDSSFKDPVATSGPARTKDGKPEVLYMGAEYCPFCAAERWALTVALSKFGSFSNLQLMHSSPTDSAAQNVPTLSYYGASYTSKYLTFTPIELEDRNGKELEKPSTADYNLLMAQGGSYPFIDFGGKSIQSSASVSTDVLMGKKQTDIAASLSESNAAASQVDSAAGGFIKAICALTNGQPGDVCKPLAG